MSDAAKKTLISAYNQTAEPTRFLSSFFQTPKGNYHTSEKVEIDIERSGEDIAIAVTDAKTGYNINSDDVYSNKEFTPPVLQEAYKLNAFELMKRMAGENPFASKSFQAEAVVRAYKKFRKIEKKIRRTVELQSAQVLQTAKVTLVDSDGNPRFTIDFKGKASHFPTAGVAWDQAGADPIKDLEPLGQVVRRNGLVRPNQLLFGEGAFSHFIANEKVQKHFENRRIDNGTISSAVVRGEGGTYRGVVQIGSYKFDVWTYDATYTHPQTGIATPYLDDGKVIVRSDKSRMDLTFGAIPTLVPMDSRVLKFLPNRLINTKGGMDLSVNAWLSNDGQNLFVGGGSRPLTIPTAIDSYACLDTGI